MIHYFDKPGKENTAKTVELAIQAAKDHGISTIVVATGSGETPLLFRDAAKEGIHVVAVTRARQQLEEAGIDIVTTTHVLSGAERGLSRKFTGVYPVEIMAHTLRMFGQGTKVCVECAVMALDCGAIAPGPVVCVAGTGVGADTCWILRPAHAQDILDTKLDELICKPILP